MFNTFNFMAINRCCILGPHITLLYPPPPTLYVLVDMIVRWILIMCAQMLYCIVIIWNRRKT